MNVEELTSKPPEERDVLVLQSLAAGQYAFGQYRTAVDLLHLASRLAPNNAETFVMMSRIQYAIGDLDEAVALIDVAASKAPGGLAERDQIFERRIRLLDDLAEQQRLLG